MNDRSQPLLKVEHVRQLVEAGQKQWALVIAGTDETTQFLTWGKSAKDKVYVSDLSEYVSRQLCGDTPATVYESFHDKLEAAKTRADLEHLRTEVGNVLLIMDQLSATWGDEGAFRRCRDRLRAAINGRATEDT